MSLNEPIPSNELSRLDPELRAQVGRAVEEVLASGWFVLGPQGAALERELCAYLGIQEAVLVGNGTDALELALAAVGVERGDTVMTVANAGAYTSVAARQLGAVPVYCDVAPDTLLISAESFSAALARLDAPPRAVVVTHLYGALAPVEEIVAIAHHHGIAVVEDCAQALGARSGGRMAGTFGDIATISFYPTKNLGAVGDGGAVVSNRRELAEAVRRMRQYGWASKYHIAHSHGRNSRMDEVQAAVVRVKLPHLDAWNTRRRELHSVYETSTGSARTLNTSTERFSAHLAVLLAEDRDRQRAELGRLGIGTDIHYPVPDHRQGFPDGVLDRPSLPVTEWAAKVIFSVPLFPELTDDEARRVRDALSAM